MLNYLENCQSGTFLFASINMKDRKGICISQIMNTLSLSNN